MTERTLSDYAHARSRLEMYLGSRELHTQSVLCFDGTNVEIKEQTWIPSLFCAFRELVDNSLDEILAHGHGDTLKVSYDPTTMIIEVEDNGRGIPIHEIPAVGKGPAASYMMSNPRSGRNFDERKTVAGMNGVGGALVNFSSEWFVLDVWRDGKKFHQRWDEGQYAKNPIHKTAGPSITKGSKTRTGTRVKFKPSEKVWTKMVLPLDFIESRMWDIALANPTLKVWFNGKRMSVSGRDPVIATMFVEPKATLIETKTDSVHTRFYVVAGHTDDTHIHSMVNNIPTFLGGTHVDEFKTLFYNGLIDKLDAVVKKELNIKSKDTVLSRNDVMQGLLIYNITVMDDPQFDSQSKTRLITDIRAAIRGGFFESDVAGFIRKNPAWVQQVVERCRSRTQTSQIRELAKEQKKLAKNKVATLKDATGKDRRKCILHIAEGESAIAGLVSARDARIHGGIGLRGKVMNVHGVAPKKVLSSKALTDLMSSIGLEIGKVANPMHLRYGRVYICCDADEDGKNIIALLVNFFYTFWPELFADKTSPFFYVFDTPLVILTKGKRREYVYADAYNDFNPADWSGWGIIRAKGLARLVQEDWKNVLSHPKLIPIHDDGNLKDVLDLIFNPSKADERKTWLST